MAKTTVLTPPVLTWRHCRDFSVHDASYYAARYLRENPIPEPKPHDSEAKETAFAKFLLTGESPYAICPPEYLDKRGNMTTDAAKNWKQEQQAAGLIVGQDEEAAAFAEMRTNALCALRHQWPDMVLTPPRPLRWKLRYQPCGDLDKKTGHADSFLLAVPEAEPANGAWEFTLEALPHAFVTRPKQNTAFLLHTYILPRIDSCVITDHIMDFWVAHPGAYGPRSVGWEVAHSIAAMEVKCQPQIIGVLVLFIEERPPNRPQLVLLGQDNCKTKHMSYWHGELRHLRERYENNKWTGCAEDLITLIL